MVEERFMPNVSMTVNGVAVSANVDSRTLLAQFVRDTLHLTGTHIGCDTSQCGACVVHVDGRAVKSCTTLAVSCEGAHVTTIEGIGTPDHLHPMQAAFRENHGLQCGFCTPGMLMRAYRFLQENPNPSEEEIRAGMSGNLCRCTGYQNIVKSVQYAANKLREATAATA